MKDNTLEKINNANTVSNEINVDHVVDMSESTNKNNTFNPNRPNRKERRKMKAENRSIEKKFNKEFSSNNEWSRLKTELYPRALSLFYPVQSLTDSLRSRGETLKYMTSDEKEVFVMNCSILQRDIVAYKKELDMIYAIHADKDGNCAIEDWQTMLQITEKYFIFCTNFNSIVSPIYDHIVDLLLILEQRQLQHESQETTVSE